MEIQLGDIVKDTISGFVGIAVAKAEYIEGCNRITVQPKYDGKELKDVETFDEGLLEVMVANKRKKEDEDSGGPELYKVKNK